jgi:phosphoribosylformylglycinamidine (FGAM) synthase-like enzyme
LEIALIGPLGAELGGSEYQRLLGVANVGPRPALDLDLETRLHRAVLAAADQGLLRAAHDCAAGGLLVALAEMAIAGSIGCRVTLPPVTETELLGQLVGETQSRIIVCHRPNDRAQIARLCTDAGIDFWALGTTGGGDLEMMSADGVSLVAQPLVDLTVLREGALA